MIFRSLKDKNINKNLGKYQRYTAFTLAEILITLGIIGIVAAITLPILTNNTKNQAMVSSLKENTSILKSAVQSIITDNGGSFPSINFTGSPSVLLPYFSQYLSLNKQCYRNQNIGECFHDGANYTQLDGEPVTAASGWITNFNAHERMILLNGSLVGLRHYWNCGGGVAGTGIYNNKICADLVLDVNGFNPPNQIGRDIFFFYILEYNGLIPRGGQGSETSYGGNWNEICTTVKTGSNPQDWAGVGCSARILQEGQMNY